MRKRRAARRPDPVVGVGIFLVGLLIMAVGGAGTWHYVFNAGEGLLLLGAVVFLASVARTALLQDPVDWRLVARELLGREDHDEAEPPPESRSGRE